MIPLFYGVGASVVFAQVNMPKHDISRIRRRAVRVFRLRYGFHGTRTFPGAEPRKCVPRCGGRYHRRLSGATKKVYVGGPPSGTSGTARMTRRREPVAEQSGSRTAAGRPRGPVAAATQMGGYGTSAPSTWRKTTSPGLLVAPVRHRVQLHEQLAS